MPTSAETVVNKALSGTETKELLKRDFDRLLANFGELNDYVAYGRLGYRITLTLQTGNAFRPEVTSEVESQEPLPIEADDAATSAYELERQIDSPNEERVRAGMPVPVKVRGLDGTTQTEMAKYPPQPELGEGKVSVADVTPREAEKLEVKRRGRPKKSHNPQA